MNFRRVNAYDDPRFDQEVLCQHGAFLADERWLCEIRIVSADSAVVRVPEGFPVCELEGLIAEFRFYAEHITRFFDENGGCIAELPQVRCFSVPLADIQPSQFYVDADKLAAVRSFIRGGEDAVVPLSRGRNGRWIALDGHTRMFCALQMGADTVRGFEAKAGDCIEGFVQEAQRRGVRSPQDLRLLPHAEYKDKWDGFCESFFASRNTK